MSNFGNIATGLVTVLEANIPSMKAFSYPRAGAINQFPTAVVLPNTLDPEQAFQGNTFVAVFRIVVLVSSGDDAEGFARLYDLIDPTTTNLGIKQALDADSTLDGSADDSHLLMIENIGRREVDSGWFFGFDALVEVIKTVA